MTTDSSPLLKNSFHRHSSDPQIPCNVFCLTSHAGAWEPDRTPFFISFPHRHQFPNIIVVLTDGAIRRENTAASGVDDAHIHPAILITIGI